MKTLFLNQLEHALNAYLALDPESSRRLKKLSQKIVLLKLEGLSIQIAFQFLDNKMVIVDEKDLHPDVTIQGTPLSLLHLSLTDDRHRFFSEDVVIHGNLELGQALLDVFDALEIDWEEMLSRWTGDVLAHKIGRVFYQLKNFSQRNRKVFLADMNDYLHEEAEFLPTREALQDFFEDIDNLRMTADRLEARLEKLSGEII
jgi:ubiquinone biosynthesis protein UbiJ